MHRPTTHSNTPYKMNLSKLSDEDIADFEVLRDIGMATIFGFLLWVHIGAT